MSTSPPVDKEDSPAAIFMEPPTNEVVLPTIRLMALAGCPVASPVKMLIDPVFVAWPVESTMSPEFPLSAMPVVNTTLPDVIPGPLCPLTIAISPPVDAVL